MAESAGSDRAQMIGEVRRQYEAWPYPVPVASLDEEVLDGLNIAAQRFDLWPEGAPDAPSILVAGCATFQAAAVAQENPRSRVLGIDISASAVEASARLKARHGLENLELKQFDVSEVCTLGERFDFISAVGVLHHMSDPVGGGLALKSALKPDGVMHVAVHSRNVRTGVEMLQRTFKLLELDFSREDVSLVRATLAQLDPNHPVQRYLAVTPELSLDEAIVDTFLSPLDWSFSAEELFAFIDAIGMRFQGWEDRAKHSILARLSPSHPLLEKMLRLDARSRAITLDNLIIPQGSHSVFLRHAELDPRRYVLDIERDPKFPLWRIHLSPKLRRRRDQNNAIVLSVDGCELTPASATIELLNSFDGARTLQESLRLFECAGRALPRDRILRDLIGQLYELNFIMIEKC